MFKNTFQSGFLSILYSIGSKPLQIWDKKVRNGHIKRITDNDIQSLVLEIVGTNVSTTYITCPADPKRTLGIKLPFLVMIIKNLKKYFTFEVQVRNNSNNLVVWFFTLLFTWRAILWKFQRQADGVSKDSLIKCCVVLFPLNCIQHWRTTAVHCRITEASIGITFRFCRF